MEGALRRLDAAQPGGGIAGRLGKCRGPEAQILRLLLWGKETKPRVRRKLLYQGLLECEPLPTNEKLIVALEQLTRCRASDEISSRRSEVEELLADTRVKKRKKEIHRSKDSSGLLSMCISGDNLLGSGVFDASVEVRRDIYSELPPPFKDRWLEGPHTIRGETYILMWSIEHNTNLRREFLIPRIENSFLEDNPRPDYWSKKLEPLLVGMTDEEKTVRRETIRNMRPPVLTEEEKAQDPVTFVD